MREQNQKPKAKSFNEQENRLNTLLILLLPTAVVCTLDIQVGNCSHDVKGVFSVIRSVELKKTRSDFFDGDVTEFVGDYK